MAPKTITLEQNSETQVKGPEKPVGIRRSGVARSRQAFTWRREEYRIQGRLRSIFRDIKTGRFIEKPLVLSTEEKIRIYRDIKTGRFTKKPLAIPKKQNIRTFRDITTGRFVKSPIMAPATQNVYEREIRALSLQQESVQLEPPTPQKSEQETLEYANELRIENKQKENSNKYKTVLEATAIVFITIIVIYELTFISDLLWLLWLIQAPYMAYFFGRYVQNRKRYVNNSYESEEALYINSEAQHGRVDAYKPFLVTQITSRDGPSIVQDVIDKSNSITNEVLQHGRYTNIGHRIDLVIEENANKKYYFHDTNVVIVPSDYKTSKGSKYKCRALQYATELRREKRENTKDYWILHLDEESFVTRQSMESILKYISNSNSPPVAEGPIIYPNKLLEVNPICRVVESMRPYICYDCVSQFDGSRLPMHMHGSNLLVRAHIEDNIGWDYQNPASEDQRFGHNVWLEYGPKAFGWHGGIIEEQPPFSINWLIKARRRWFVGDLYNMRTGSIPLRNKVEIAGMWFSWSTGFISGLISIAALVLPQSIPEPMKIFLSTITILWFFSYQQGLRENLRPLELSKLKRIYYHLQTAFLTPLAGLIETYGVFSAPFYIHNYKWEPTEKVRMTERNNKELQFPELEEQIYAS